MTVFENYTDKLLLLFKETCKTHMYVTLHFQCDTCIIII